ncbi:hypothetical protein LBMAG42_36000 [Deltaproteobacteria bacterium]|nr:hypothetical protein LBMAG42_36000 [Deltaproteobacteria bacterium]
MSTTASASRPIRAPHPSVYTVLYLPFGALGGFITVALTFLATRSGLSITEGALLGGAQMISQWLKWTWAPAIDVTLTPKRWYVFATACSALGVFGMAVVPLGPDTLWLLLAIIAIASLINSIVGMSIEAILAQATPRGEEGRVSAWFQAGNLGGTGLGGALGLYLLQVLPEPWMAGAIMGGLFMACCGALVWVPDIVPHRAIGGVVSAVQGVIGDLFKLGRARGGFLAAILCFLPLGTGAGQGVLTQAAVAEVWGAGATEVALVQGLFAGILTAAGCFVGGWLCKRFHPRTAYAVIGLLLAVVGLLFGLTTPGSPLEMAFIPAVYLYIGWNLLYSLVVGFAYAAFTALVLNAIGSGSAATKYSIYASLSNFPIWWLGLLLGTTADKWGPATMLYTESAIATLGVVIFGIVVATMHEAPELGADDTTFLEQRYRPAYVLAGRLRTIGMLTTVAVWLVGGVMGIQNWDVPDAAYPGELLLVGSAFFGIAVLVSSQVVAAMLVAFTDAAVGVSPLSPAQRMRVLRDVAAIEVEEDAPGVPAEPHGDAV